jgi:antirestriction protein
VRNFGITLLCSPAPLLLCSPAQAQTLSIGEKSGESEEDFVYDQLEEQGLIKKLEEMGVPSSYINWEAIARDWFIDSYYSVEEGYKKVYIFSRF